jgi:hypothetical protein
MSCPLLAHEPNFEMKKVEYFLKTGVYGFCLLLQRYGVAALVLLFCAGFLLATLDWFWDVRQRLVHPEVVAAQEQKVLDELNQMGSEPLGPKPTKNEMAEVNKWLDAQKRVEALRQTAVVVAIVTVLGFFCFFIGRSVLEEQGG